MKSMLLSMLSVLDSFEHSEQSMLAVLIMLDTHELDEHPHCSSQNHTLC